jgi:hypothetical protein
VAVSCFHQQWPAPNSRWVESHASVDSKDPGGFFARLVTGDESWSHYYTPEGKIHAVEAWLKSSAQEISYSSLCWQADGHGRLGHGHSSGGVAFPGDSSLTRCRIHCATADSLTTTSERCPLVGAYSPERLVCLFVEEMLWQYLCIAARVPPSFAVALAHANGILHSSPRLPICHCSYLDVLPHVVYVGCTFRNFWIVALVF